MANIGYLRRNNDGALIGKIETLAFNHPVGLRPFKSDKPNAPRYEIVALGADRRTWIAIGAAWEQFSNRTGVAFYQGTIDDPSLPGPMAVAFFANDDGGYSIAWSRKRPRREIEAAGDASNDGFDAGMADDAGFVSGMTDTTKRGKKAAAPADDGLGASTAN